MRVAIDTFSPQKVAYISKNEATSLLVVREILRELRNYSVNTIRNVLNKKYDIVLDVEAIEIKKGNIGYYIYFEGNKIEEIISYNNIFVKRNDTNLDSNFIIKFNNDGIEVRAKECNEELWEEAKQVEVAINNFLEDIKNIVYVPLSRIILNSKVEIKNSNNDTSIEYTIKELVEKKELLEDVNYYLRVITNCFITIEKEDNHYLLQYFSEDDDKPRNLNITNNPQLAQLLQLITAIRRRPEVSQLIKGKRKPEIIIIESPFIFLNKRQIRILEKIMLDNYRNIFVVEI
jgi:hypothetical protein